MTRLDALCDAHGVIWRYRDTTGQWQEAPEASRRAALLAMAVDPDGPLPAPAPPGWQVLEADRPAPLAPDHAWWLVCEDGATDAGAAGVALPPLPPGLHRLEGGRAPLTLIAAPARLPAPPRRWGVTAPLYGLWEGMPAGLGSYAQLGDLAKGLGRLGAAFLGINPVHAGFPRDPAAFSPYAPSHRRRLNVLHVATTSRPGTMAAPLIEHGAEIPAQLRALEAAHRRFLAVGGDPAFDAWCTAEGEGLHRFCLHQALSERHGPYWTNWPAALQDPDTAEVAAFGTAHADRLEFHAWAQWQAVCQLDAAQAQARAAGMALGLYLDLAVGTHPAGAETWAQPGLFARGVSLGAPPDRLGPSGQSWGLAPLRPDALAADGFAALADTLRAQLRHSGMLRIDHVLGFERAFWVPEGLPGLYVRMPKAAMLAVTRLEAARAGAVIVGEDLGNIPDGLRADLEASGLLGCRVAMFERDWQGDGRFVPGLAYDAQALASFGTHDLPTWRGWRAGAEIGWREGLGEMTPEAADAARAARACEVADFDALTGGGADGGAAPLHRHLAESAAALVAVQVEDMLDCREQANLPGTIHSHPNWRRRLPLPASAIAADARVQDTASIMARAGRNEGPTCR